MKYGRREKIQTYGMACYCLGMVVIAKVEPGSLIGFLTGALVVLVGTYVADRAL